MSRAIDLDGVKPPDGSLGRATFRSADGSDLPARVFEATRQFIVAGGAAPTRVHLGRYEWSELATIVRKEWANNDGSYQLPPGLRVAGLVAHFEADHESMLLVQ